MQGNLFYKPQVLQNLGDFLPLKDLLNTATLSKEHHQLLRKYLQDHYQLPSHQHSSPFSQLQHLFNRKLFVWNKGQPGLKINPSGFIPRNIHSQEDYTLVKTLDSQFRLAKTPAIIQGQKAELLTLPQPYRLAGLTDNAMLYCAQGQKITRYSLRTDFLSNADHLPLKGEVEGLVCGPRFSIAVVRESPQQVRFLLFDDKEPLGSFRVLETPFVAAHFDTEDHLVMGRGASYLVFNQTLYEVNVKNHSLYVHPEFEGRAMVRILAGKNHFMGFERVQKRSEQWTNEEVIQFAMKEGFQDYVKIFRTEKVTGQTLLTMDKKYMEEVLGLINVKLQQKIKLRVEESNTEQPEHYLLHGWGRAAEGQLGTHHAKELSKPNKVKLPPDSRLFALSGNFTFLLSKDSHLLVNSIDEQTNKLDWKEITQRKVWSIATVEDAVVLVASAAKQKGPQRESEHPISEKKQKLRTAKNIIDKITWSGHLSPSEFKVGYLDKYDGILEIPFAQLEKSEIKEYRIEYFKHGSQVVWDKKKRIDIL